MPYTKTNWQSGDIISSERLNHAEEGIAQAQQTADAVNARDSLADLTDVKITGTPSTGSLLRFGYTPDGDKWQPYTLPNYMDQWQWINESSPNENRLQYNANIIYSWLGNSNGHMYRVKIGKRIIAMTEYYADLVNSIYEFKFGDVVYRATAGNEKPVIVEDGISAISDVDITTPTDGQIILYDATNSKWVNGSSTQPEVNLTMNSNGYLSMTGSELETIAATSKVRLNITSNWSKSAVYNGKTITMSAGPGTYYLTAFMHPTGTSYRRFYFQGLDNVQYFMSSGDSDSPQARFPEKGLNDNNINVLISSPTSDQVLKYDGSHWVNTTPDMSLLTDTQITSPSEGQVLTYDATNNVWINATSNTGVNNLSDLSDVALGDNVSTGQILRYNKTSGKWQNQAYTAMDAYTYVNSGDNSLLYTSDALWVTYIQYGRPIAINTATLGFIPLTKAINDNNTTYTFIFGDRVYSGSRYTTPTFVEEGLGTLKGINITSPTDGQVLTYDATNSVWKNATPSSDSGDAPVILTLEDYTDTEGTYGTANTTYLYADDYGIITYSRLSEAFDSGEQIAFKATETVGSYYPSISLRKSNGMAYFQADNIIYTAVEENDGKFIKQNTRTEFYYKMEGRTLTGPRAPEVIRAVELGLDVKLYCDFSLANNTSTTQQFLKIKKLKLEFSYKCYNEDRQCYDYIFQAHDHVPIEYTDPTKQMSFSILYHDNSEYGSYYGASF